MTHSDRAVGNNFGSLTARRRWDLTLLAITLLAGLCVTAHGQSSVTLAWDPSPSPDVTGYNVYSGAASQTYTNIIPVGNVTNATVTGLVPGTTYYFAVTALDAAGLESQLSNETSYAVPVTNSVSTTNSTPVNTPPLISGIPTQTINEGSSTAALPFTVQDAETPAANLVVTATSSNPALVAAGGIVLGGTDTNRTVTVTPTAGQTGSATITLTVCDPSLCASTTFTVTVTAPALPPPWQTSDVGSVGVTGSASGSNGVYTIQGAGNIGGSADNFRFVYQTLSGDGEIACQISATQKTGGGSDVGVMIRESLTSGSRYAFMGINSTGAFRAQRRVTTSGGTSTAKSGQGSPPNTWVRIVRSGDTLSCYRSTDGGSWALANSSTISMASDIYVGLAVASGSSTVLNTSQFANVTVVP